MTTAFLKKQSIK